MRAPEPHASALVSSGSWGLSLLLLGAWGTLASRYGRTQPDGPRAVVGFTVSLFTWSLFAPFVWLPAVLVGSALFGHALIFLRLWMQRLP
ncbi:hypothetical protein JYJ95_20630 [Corallococcus exiguus]|uniref:hypothetical protein n=1 Tax=Corallococcus exiguus TaxID=83462 RepID=UPI001A8CA110|nr:hypothetical protein [Corallococcus exiguus]MBN8468914.1 hypothetical protein [Corallococcus exiguus]